MRSLSATYLCILLLLSGLLSCSQKTPVVVESVSFDTLTVDTICPLFHSYDKPSCHLVIKMATPSTQTPIETLQAIERFISTLPKDGSFEDDANGSVESMVQAYVRAYIMQYLNEGHDAIGNHEVVDEEIEVATTWMNYEEIVEGSILYNDYGLISYQVVTDSYTGGAHGNKTIDNGVFYLTTLDQITLSDIFNDEAISELNSLVRNKLMHQFNCTSLEELSEKGQFTSPNDIVATENFFINKEGITWTYDPFEIAPYSVGVVTITLSWDEFYPLLASDSPILAIANKIISQ